MKRLIIFAVCWATTIYVCWAQKADAGDVKNYVEYTKADSALVVKLLTDAQNDRGDGTKHLGEESRIIYFGKKFLGVPYVAHTLEKGDKEHLIVNLHELDCTTFVETVVALALCDLRNERTFDDFCKNLTTIRYRNGQMKDYTSRLHYFTWWAEDNERLGLVRDISTESEPFTAVQTISINYMSSHPALYKQLKNHSSFVPAIKKMEQDTNGKKFRYIPKKNLVWQKDTSLGIVHDGDIVAMLTDRDGLDTRHIGIAFWKNGHLHLLHASSLYKRVLMSDETFYEYEQKQPKHIGIRVFRFND